MARPPRRDSEPPRRDSESLDQSLLQVRERGSRIADDQLFDQRNSFAIGSAALANSTLTRSSIVDLAPKPYGEAERATQTYATIEVANLVRQYDFIISSVKAFLAAPPAHSSYITPDLIRTIHQISFDGLSAEAGNFRHGSVAISNIAFQGSPAEQIPALVQELCDYVNHNWSTSSALHLSAYALWRLLWIHPFSDGNGRVARALSYLVLSTKVGAILPGTPTLPELISLNRNDYYAALELADKAQLEGKTNVKSVEEFIGRLLVLQLQNIAFLPASTKTQLDEVVGARIMRASEDMKRACYGAKEVKYRLWSHGPYLILHVGAENDIQSARERQMSFGDPFPGLLSAQEGLASRILTTEQASYMFSHLDLDISRKRAFYLMPDISLILSAVRCRGDVLTYLIEGAIYCVRLGPRTTIENCHETFDFLIARHMRAAS